VGVEIVDGDDITGASWAMISWASTISPVIAAW